MNARKLLVPLRAEGDGIIGDGVVEIGPDHPDYPRWVEYFKRMRAAVKGAKAKKSKGRVARKKASR